MTIQVIEQDRQGDYFSMVANAGKNDVAVLVAPTYINVRVLNASAKAWRGTGKCFDTAEEAIANYKSSDVKAVIAHAVEASKEAVV